MEMLTLNGLRKTFNPGTVNEKIALDGVSLHMEAGDFATIVGSNGAGKSTLFNTIAGTFLPDSGTITLDGRDITKLPDYRRSKQIGRLFQDPLKGTAPHMTIEENLALAYTRSGEHTSMFSRAITKEKVKFFRENLARYNMGIEDRMKTKIGLLSGGQRQVVTLLMCTLSVPKLLLLDEHTAALDPETAKKVMEITKQIVSENHITTMMITHNLQQALDTGNRTIMMDSGEIVFDISGKKREQMTVKDLVALFAEKRKKELTNDRMMLG